MNAISFRTPTTHESVVGLVNWLQQAGAPRVVHVCSPGGELECFSEYGPAIARRHLTTIAEDVRSAAVILFMLGQHRCALPQATFFFHEVRAITEYGAVTLVDLEAFREQHENTLQRIGKMREVVEEYERGLRNAQNWFVQFMAHATDLPVSTFLRLTRGQATLDAREALRYGIVHRILALEEVENLRFV